TPQWLVIGVPPMAVRTDVDVVEKHFSIVNPREAVPQVHTALEKGLHFRSEQRDPRLERFEHVEKLKRLAVLIHVGLSRLTLGFLCHRTNPGPSSPSPGARQGGLRRSCSTDRPPPFRLCQTPFHDRPTCAQWATRASR